MISKGSKQGAGLANLRKREKQMDYYALKRGWAGQPKEKKENEWINRG